MPKNEYLESRIGVMETKWYEHRNTSVRELFNLLSELLYAHHHAYRYEMFGGASEFKETFNRLAQKNGVHYIYVGAHGEAGAIAGTMGSGISTEMIGDCISFADKNGGKLVGLYFGSCLFGNHNNLITLLEKGSKLRWIAGYGKTVDFVKSSVFDLLFFYTFISVRLGRKVELTEIEAIKVTADRLTNEVGGLMMDLGFSLYLWERNQVLKLI